MANDTLTGIENAIGSPKNDTIYGDAANNVLDGGTGGADSINGGGGTDTVSYAHSSRGVIIDLGGQVTWDGVSNDTLSSIESAIGSSFNDTFYSNALANRFDGGAGIDTVSYASSSAALLIDLGGQVTWDGTANDTLVSIENATGSSLGDTFLQQCAGEQVRRRRRQRHRQLFGVIGRCNRRPFRSSHLGWYRQRYAGQHRECDRFRA